MDKETVVYPCLEYYWYSKKKDHRTDMCKVMDKSQEPYLR